MCKNKKPLSEEETLEELRRQSDEIRRRIREREAEEENKG